jgi:D-alanine transaminase
MDLVYLNGNYVPAETASIPVLDRGFMFGDGVYEVLPVYSGKVFRVNEHMQRLQRSLQAVDMRCAECENTMHDIFSSLIENNIHQGDGFIYLQVTRGVMQIRDQAYDRDMKPTVLVMCQALDYPSQNKDTKGIRAITLDDNRWMDCYIKSINLLPNVLLRQQAIDSGAKEAILIRDSLAVEGTSSNLFVVKGDIIFTPPQTRYMLGGITRELILEICAKNKILVREMPVTEDQLHDADEIWMTSSTREIMPVTTLNQHKVGKGVPGPMWMQLIDLYQDFKKSVMRGE